MCNSHYFSLSYAPVPFCACQITTVVFSQNRAWRSFSDTYHYSIDLGIGYTMFAIMGIFSFSGFMGAFQMKMLFNDSFSEKVRGRWT